MRLTYNWLKDYVDTEAEPQELADLLTMAGLEVEAVEPLGKGLQGVIAGRVISIEEHPNADNLSICMVETGAGQVPVVCGAPNLKVGMAVPYSPPGTRLPNGMVVREARIRGVESRGMLLAEDEMGLTDDHSGLMVLPERTDPGTPIERAAPVIDWAMEIGITPNRPDCTSVIGIAREVAAKSGARLRLPTEHKEINRLGPGSIDEQTSVKVDDPEGCPRYTAGLVKGVRIGPSPFWMRYRLYCSGIRCISNVVDITNYVLLEMGQPLHAFDFHRLRGHRILVRRAAEGELFTTLDGQERRLSSADLMICDAEGPVGLAGVMGGLNSEIQEDTEDVLVESACFDPVTIRRTAKRLGLSTEASYRFERGVDIEGADRALYRSLELLEEIALGAVVPGILDIYPSPYNPCEIILRVDKTNELLGTALPPQTMSSHLESLGIEVAGDSDGNTLRARPPSFRVDLKREVDLVEEVARMEGYDHIPVTYPAVRPSEEPDPAEVSLGDRVRDVMVGFGFTEVITFSFISMDAPDLLGAPEGSRLRATVPLVNPLSRDQGIMRTTLLPGLLQALSWNTAHGERNLKLFEWGKVYLRVEGAELPDERLALAGAISGASEPRTLYCQGREADFFDVKGVVEGLLVDLGLEEPVFEAASEDTPPPGLNPRAAARVLVEGVSAGTLGECDPGVAERWGLKSEKVFLFELDIPVVMKGMPLEHRHRPFARFPAVIRDLCVVLDNRVESADVRRLIQEAGGDLVESVDLFDLYRGDQIGPSEKALTFRISFRSRERTLDGREVNLLHEKIVRKIEEKAGGRLRDG
ncbi:MAG: phenylalanine--tRNA ligase subunit beta [Desulfobacteraceae bacterium]